MDFVLIAVVPSEPLAISENEKGAVHFWWVVLVRSHLKQSTIFLPPFCRRCRSDRTLELPSDVVDLEVVSRAGHGQHGGVETRHLHETLCFVARRNLRRGWTASGSFQRHNGTG